MWENVSNHDIYTLCIYIYTILKHLFACISSAVCAQFTYCMYSAERLPRDGLRGPATSVRLERLKKTNE